MCRNQNCFRARLTPKPWRINMRRLHPSLGVWPLGAEFLANKSDWVKEYETKSERFATCHFLAHIGSKVIDSRAEHVREIHDELCKVKEYDLKIA
jgi:hypothetical protein